MIDRIKQLLDWQQLSPTQFADRIGVGRPVVSHILSERNKPSLEVARSIKAAFPELSLDWLVNGSGAMLVAPAPTVAAASGTLAPTAAILPATPPLGTQGPDPAAMAIPAPELGQPADSIPEPRPAPAQRAAVAAVPAATGPVRFRAGTIRAAAAVPEAAAARFVAGAAKSRPAELPVHEQPDLTASIPRASLAATGALSSPQAPTVEPVSAGGAGIAATAPVAPPSTPTETAALAQALSEGLGTPGKTIRRIVLFYTDGSFADFKPE